MEDMICLSAKEAAQYLGMSYQKFLSLAAAGEIPHFKIRKTYYFRVDVFRSWLELKRDNPGNNQKVSELLKEEYPWIKIR